MVSPEESAGKSQGPHSCFPPPAVLVFVSGLNVVAGAANTAVKPIAIGPPLGSVTRGSVVPRVPLRGKGRRRAHELTPLVRCPRPRELASRRRCSALDACACEPRCLVAWLLHQDKVIDFCSGGCTDFGRTVTLQHYHPDMVLPPVEEDPGSRRHHHAVAAKPSELDRVVR